MSYRILVINPGSTSTKIGVYEDEQLLFDKTLRHSAEDIAQFKTIAAQKDWRRDLVMRALREQGIDARTLSAVSGRGGLLRPIRGGTYAVNDNMVTDCTIGIQGQHASNLGGLIAREIGDELGIPSYIVDPVVIDEMADVARYAGHPLFQRVSIFHALNQKAVAKRFAKEQGKKYEELNLIVCHMGGGVSIGAHMKGSVVDTQNALDGEGPFSPERSGSLPTGQLVKQCFSGKYTEGEMHRMLSGRGGLVAYTGSNDMRYLWRRPNTIRRSPVWWTRSTIRSARRSAPWPPLCTARWIRSSSPAASPTARRRWMPFPRWSAGSPPSPSTPARTSCWRWRRALSACSRARSRHWSTAVPVPTTTTDLSAAKKAVRHTPDGLFFTFSC